MAESKKYHGRPFSLNLTLPPLGILFQAGITKESARENSFHFLSFRAVRSRAAARTCRGIRFPSICPRLSRLAFAGTSDARCPRFTPRFWALTWAPPHPRSRVNRLMTCCHGAQVPQVHARFLGVNLGRSSLPVTRKSSHDVLSRRRPSALRPTANRRDEQKSIPSLGARGASAVCIRVCLQAYRKCRVMNPPSGAAYRNSVFTTGW